ncbi:DUF2933 domain-containing protein [Paenibacillus thiaminolyticus]|uniref:DUF2933 domain-containing protein n=1 Tax=Paenibacillus thiaminolyticus TaxID=49283 RepID=A0A3A3GGX4_PANTH|nr:DUF2933 domain-containing protein [Paenibacillus thiaminolyticus]RJG22473.1 hypothetical protein DQX05_17620 [Paenibacillus thiaminolyticus]
MDWTWLLLLACPIMMVLMMFGMHGGHGHGHGNHGKGTPEDMQKMQRELDEVKAQNERMRKDIQNLSR